MKIAAVLCVVFLVVGYKSAPTNNSSSPRRQSPELRKTPFGRSSSLNSKPGPTERHVTGSQLRSVRSSRRSHQLLSPTTIPTPTSAAAPFIIPKKLIESLGKYDERTMQRAQRRFDSMDIGGLRDVFNKTKLFAGLISGFQQRAAQQPDGKKALQAYLNQRVARALTEMENSMGIERTEDVLIRAMLDSEREERKGRATAVTKPTK